MRLANTVAIVTGGSSGIGRAIATRFASEGARVVSADIVKEPREGGETTEALLDGRGFHHDTNVSRWTDVDRLVGTVIENFNRLDVMVCNAGVAGVHSKPLLETSEEDWDAIMGVNLKGVFFCCKRAIAQMLQQDPVGETRGRVITISSQYGMVGGPDHVAYAASKGGVVNLTRQLAVDYARHGIAVNGIAPGKIVTGTPDREDSGTLAYSRSRTPYPRLGRPDDVAGAAVFLASEDASYIAGTTLLVDGGWLAY
jgi:NAD(P)-dependent dehydrogenase (short-subunit alcohol dehydrogenase family)